MNPSEALPTLYRELASWWSLLSSPEHYVDEARDYQQILDSVIPIVPCNLLELGSGGGNNAYHLKKHYTMTLIDLSEGMLAVSQKLNPDCEHIKGDMRTVRLGRQFDAVFIHDAIGYMSSEDDLLQALVTAYVHCRSGGVAIFVPDHTRETFKPSTSHGGKDNNVNGMRYLEWTFDPDPADSTYVSYMAYLLREGKDDVRCVLDTHLMGLFSRTVWLRLITQAGFEASSYPVDHGPDDTSTSPVFIGIKSCES